MPEATRTPMEKLVHEAMLTLAVLPPAIRKQKLSYWPDYIYEHEDYGARPDLSEDPPRERPPWHPRPRHVTQMEAVLHWYGSWMGQDRRRNGLFKWEYALLETRAWQFLCGKPSWRAIAYAMEGVERAPTRSHEWWRHRHDDLIQIAELQARLIGDAKVLAHAA